MSKTEPSLSREKFNALAQMADSDVRVILTDHETILPVSKSDAPANSVHRKFSFLEALTFELARQMSDGSGVSTKEAFRLIGYTMAVESYLAEHLAASNRSDFWLAVCSCRNTWGKTPRGSWPVTAFGQKEYWSEMHYTGTLGKISGEIAESVGRDQAMHPDSDPARIIMANVSSADRRLRKRAAELGIAIEQ